MVISQATIRRARVLPAPGEVTVRVGQRVEPPDVIGRAALPGGYRVIPMARLLRVPEERLAEVCTHRAGDSVKAGDVLARGRSLPWPRVVRAPADGVIAALSEGRMILEVAPQLVELRAGLPGVVVSLIGETRYTGAVSSPRQGQGVLIETKGALVQGAWGSGQESYGLLKVMVAGPDEPLGPEAIDVSCHGCIVVGGSTLSEATLRQAQQMQVRGLVVGSLPADLREATMDLPFPVLVIDGYGGQRPMASPVFEVLQANNAHEAVLNARCPGRWEASPPELIVPLTTAGGEQLPVDSDPPVDRRLAVGMRVRILRAPYAGAIGTIKTLYERPRPLPTGGRSPGADVDLGSQKAGVVFIPYVNLQPI